MIHRYLEDIVTRDFQRKKVIVVLGARQVGKTTLLQQLGRTDAKVLHFNCDDSDDRLALTERSTTELQLMLQGYDYVLIDEAQRVKNIGLTLKKIGDLHLPSRVVVTGSSSLELANEINEPATGRVIEHEMYPLSLAELAAHCGERDVQRTLATRLIYGCYPEVVWSPEYARDTLLAVTNSYLYKDILLYKGLKKTDVLYNLVRALALQVGSEVSYNELSNLLGVDKDTVARYIDLLEKCFVVFRLNSFSRNARNEIKKGKKVYFYDNGVRNAVINNFAPIELRTDVGALWENMMIAERKKRNAMVGSYAQPFFWRTHDQAEIDYIEECDGVISTFEFKWSKKRTPKLPQAFALAYGNPDFEVVTPDNFWHFVK